jgi:hypothetical protein
MKNIKSIVLAGLVLSSSICYSQRLSRVEKVDHLLGNILKADIGSTLYPWKIDLNNDQSVIKLKDEIQGKIFIEKLKSGRVVMTMLPRNNAGTVRTQYVSWTADVLEFFAEEAKKGRRPVEIYNMDDAVTNGRFSQMVDIYNDKVTGSGSIVMVTLSNEERSQLEDVFFETLSYEDKELMSNASTDLGQALEYFMAMEDARGMLRAYTKMGKEVGDGDLVLKAMEIAQVDEALTMFVRPEVALLINAVATAYDESVYDNYMFKAAAVIADASKIDVLRSVMDEILKRKFENDSEKRLDK